MLIVTSSVCELHRQYGFNKLTDGGEVVSTTPTVTTSTPVTTGTMTETHLADISAPSELVSLAHTVSSVRTLI